MFLPKNHTFLSTHTKGFLTSACPEMERKRVSGGALGRRPGAPLGAAGAQKSRGTTGGAESASAARGVCPFLELVSLIFCFCVVLKGKQQEQTQFLGSRKQGTPNVTFEDWLLISCECGFVGILPLSGMWEAKGKPIISANFETPHQFPGRGIVAVPNTSRPRWDLQTLTAALGALCRGSRWREAGGLFAALPPPQKKTKNRWRVLLLVSL